VRAALGMAHYCGWAFACSFWSRCTEPSIDEVGQRPRPTTLTPVSGAAAEIVFDHVTKRYPGRSAPAVDDLSLTIPAGDICCLVGPSGAGKTTAMKLVNRLIDIDEGDITIGTRSVRAMDVTELRRGIGYVIQQVGLFPHMTVADNVATVPRLLGTPKGEIVGRVDELLDLVDLPAVDYRERFPSQLSGGERQRVGLARALAANPPVMLMDEPFGAVDPITRARLQHELLRIQNELRKTIIFVTHDIDEAILLGDRIAILREGGVLAQYDTPEAILTTPADDFVERFIGRDRGIKLLSLRRLEELHLAPLDRSDVPHAEGSTTLRDALSLMITSGSRSLVVLDGDRVERGVVTLDMLAELAG
jgi:osmoprotectant transport system ATP-binding protein